MNVGDIVYYLDNHYGEAKIFECEVTHVAKKTGAVKVRKVRSNAAYGYTPHNWVPQQRFHPTFASAQTQALQYLDDYIGIKQSEIARAREVYSNMMRLTVDGLH